VADSWPRWRQAPGISSPAVAEYHLIITTLEDGGLVVTGLPADHAERQQLTWRLRDVLSAITADDDLHGEGPGALWRRHARPFWWSPPRTGD
jgi:hypothetical protein